MLTVTLLHSLALFRSEILEGEPCGHQVAQFGNLGLALDAEPAPPLTALMSDVCQRLRYRVVIAALFRTSVAHSHFVLLSVDGSSTVDRRHAPVLLERSNS